MIQLSTRLSLFHSVASYWFWHILYFPIFGKYIALIDWHSKACRQIDGKIQIYTVYICVCVCMLYTSAQFSSLCLHLIKRNLLVDVDFAYLYSSNHWLYPNYILPFGQKLRLMRKTSGLSKISWIWTFRFFVTWLTKPCIRMDWMYLKLYTQLKFGLGFCINNY